MTHFRELPDGEWCVSKTPIGSSISFQMAIVTSFQTLKHLFGEPRDPSKISYNSRYEWDVIDVDSNVCCTIYEWISKGVRIEDYPTNEQVRNAPAYKWNIGAATMHDASSLYKFIKSRETSTRQAEDWADPLAAAAERRRVLLGDRMDGLRLLAERYGISREGKKKAVLVEDIVTYEYRNGIIPTPACKRE